MNITRKENQAKRRKHDVSDSDLDYRRKESIKQVVKQVLKEMIQNIITKLRKENMTRSYLSQKVMVNIREKEA